MKRYQKILIGLVVVAVTIGAGAAWADYGSRGRGCGRGEGGFHDKGFGYGRMMNDLSEADQDKAKAAIDAFRESNRELRRSIHQKEDGVRGGNGQAGTGCDGGLGFVKGNCYLKNRCRPKMAGSSHRNEEDSS